MAPPWRAIAAAAALSGSPIAAADWPGVAWTAVHQWTPLAANVTVLRHPEDDASNATLRWRILHITDAHISLDEARDLHTSGTRRMHSAFRAMNDRHLDPGTRRTPAETFRKLLRLVEQNNVDAVVLTGDIVNFPHNATVQSVLKELLAACGQQRPAPPVLFTAGNHDWLVESLGHGLREQRARFRREVLAPLYRLGRGPRPRGPISEDFSMLELPAPRRHVLGADSAPGLLILAVDNSMHEISSAQQAFVWRELARGIPALLAVHIPFMLPGVTPRNTKQVLCGDPRFGFEGDTSWHVERRERWPRSGASASTLRFVEDIVQRFAAPRGPLLGILSGHEHLHRVDALGRTATLPLRLRCDGGHPPRCRSLSQGHQPGRPLHEGLAQYVTPAACEGGHRIVEVRDARFL